MRAYDIIRYMKLPDSETGLFYEKISGEGQEGAEPGPAIEMVYTEDLWKYV